MSNLQQQQALIRKLTLERDSARDLAERAVNALHVTKKELTGLLIVMWLLASERGGSITITDSELRAMPIGARVRSSFDTEKGIYTYTAEAPVPQQEGSENTSDDSQADGDHLAGSSGVLIDGGVRVEGDLADAGSQDDVSGEALSG